MNSKSTEHLFVPFSLENGTEMKTQLFLVKHGEFKQKRDYSAR